MPLLLRGAEIVASVGSITVMFKPVPSLLSKVGTGTVGGSTHF